MPDTRTMLFIVHDRQRRWWLEAAEDRRTDGARRAGAPLPIEPQRERSMQGNRIASRLRMIIRPATG